MNTTYRLWYFGCEYADVSANLVSKCSSFVHQTVFWGYLDCLKHRGRFILRNLLSTAACSQLLHALLLWIPPDLTHSYDCCVTQIMSSESCKEKSEEEYSKQQHRWLSALNCRQRSVNTASSNTANINFKERKMFPLLFILEKHAEMTDFSLFGLHNKTINLIFTHIFSGGCEELLKEFSVG